MIESGAIGNTERLIQVLGFPVFVCLYFMARDWWVARKQATLLEKIAQVLSALNRKEIGTGDE